MTTISVTSQKQQDSFASSILKPYDVNRDRINTDNNDVTPFFNNSNHHSNSNSNVVTLNSKGKYCITSYYFDSYGGANITLPLQLQFPSKEVMDAFLFNNSNNDDNDNDSSGGSSCCCCCIQPKPTNLDDYMKQEQTVNDEEKKNIPPVSQNDKVGDNNNNNDLLFVLPVVAIEAKVTLTFGTGHAMTSKVESVNIISTYIDSDTNSILFYTNIMVRVSHVENHMMLFHTETTSNSDDSSMDSNGTNTMIIDPMEASKMKLNLEIMASYYYYTTNGVPTNTTSINVDKNYDSALQLLTSTNYHQQQQQQGLSLSPIQMKKIIPIPLELYVSLVHTIQISNPRIMTHPTNMGETYIALTITHANIHSNPIHITNIALHPHFSNNHQKKKNIRFKWGFVTPTTTTINSDQVSSSERMNPNRITTTTTNDWNTMTIYPHESQSILLFVEQQQSSSPLPIQNIVSNHDDDGSIIIEDNTSFSSHCTLTISTNTMATNTTTSSVTAEAVYTTNITYMATPTTTTTTTGGGSVATNTTTTVASGSTKVSDVFHISMSLEQSQRTTDGNSTSMNDRHSNNIVSLGKPFIVNIDVFDPTTNHQQLLKLVVLDAQKRNTETNITGQPQSNNDENIRPIQKGLLKQHSGNDLLMIDTDVLLLPVVEPKEGSHHPATAATTTTILRGQLRMIPLRTGTIMIPNFYIMDKSNGNIYYCYHKFQAIVQ